MGRGSTFFQFLFHKIQMLKSIIHDGSQNFKKKKHINSTDVNLNILSSLKFFFNMETNGSALIQEILSCIFSS